LHCLFQFGLHCGQFVFTFCQALLALLRFLLSPLDRTLQRPNGRKVLPVGLSRIAQLFSLSSDLCKQRVPLSIEPKDQGYSDTDQQQYSSHAGYLYL